MIRIRGIVAATVMTLITSLSAAFTASPAGATYPGLDGKIAFVRANQIHTMSATGTGVAKLTSTGKNYRPKWSPDGKRIAYINEVGGLRDVWVMAADGATKQRVTRLGNITSNPTWSANGARLAFANSTLHTIKSTAPFGTPAEPVADVSTGSYCESEPGPVPVDRFIAWSTDGTRIAVYNHDNCHEDDSIYMYYPASGAYDQVASVGADCCGYADWSDLFWGPSNRLGFTEKDYGDYGEENNPAKVSYNGFVSAPGDVGGAPSPSGTYVAVTNASSGTAQIFRVNSNGTGRRLLAAGYQSDWQRVAP